MFIKRALGLYSKSLRVASLAAIGLLATACATTSEQPVFIAMSSQIVPPDGLQQFCIDHPEECGGEIVQATLTASEPTAGQGIIVAAGVPSWPKTNLEPAILDIGFTTADIVESATLITEEPGSATETVSPEEVPAPPAERERLQADARTMRLLQSVNREINGQLEWVEDRDVYGVDELWTLPITFGISNRGDCEDFALEKRRVLIANGIPAGALSLATAYSPETGRHAVLIVHTSVGDLVLDNANQWIVEWSQTRYRWTGIQASANLLDWRMFANS